MAYNNKSAGSSGCFVYFLIICCIYGGIDYLIHRDEINAKELKEQNDFINYWKQSNIIFFSEFKCNSSLNYDESKFIKIEKFYIFDTSREYECNIKDFHKTPIHFKRIDLQNYFSEEIKNANVLIWVKQVPGEKNGSYGDGSRAIRLNAEINFINIAEKSIYKKITIPCIGEPQEKIYKRLASAPPKDFHFGSLPYEQISEIIKNEILK